MKIYGVMIGDDYEGGNTHIPMFKLQKDAIMEANAIANKENDWGREFKQVNDLEWREGCDYIKVVTYDLI